MMMTFTTRLLSLFLACSLLIVTLTGCGSVDFGLSERASADATPSVTEALSSTLEQAEEDADIVVPVTSSEQPPRTSADREPFVTPTETETTTAPPQQTEPIVTGAETTADPDIPRQPTAELEDTDVEYDLWDDWYDYEMDTDAFVSDLIANELSVFYDVFSASVVLSGGERVYGIGFTDYAEAYQTTDGRTLFASGFVSFRGEPTVPRTEMSDGLEIERLEDEEYREDYGFVYTYTREAFSAHCVVFGNYVTYGVNANAEIVYTEQIYDEAYLRKNLDLTLGTLYSYDEDRALVDLDVGTFVPLTGVALSETIDFTALEAEINRILIEQDYNFSTVDVQTSVYIAQEALNGYLLSLQEETFMGYRVSDLVEISKQIDPMSCIRITPNGFELMEIEPTPPPTPSGLMKWLTGIVAGIAVVGGIVLAVHGSPTLGGAIIGAAVEVFTEVVVSNQMPEDIDWRKVAIASVAGAISAHLGIVADSVVGGATNATFSLMDGGNLNAAAGSFVIGTATGLALGGAFNLAGKGISKVISKVDPPKVTKTITLENAMDLDGQIAKKIDDPLVEAATYQAKKQSESFINIQLFAGKADDIYVASPGLKNHFDFPDGPYTTQKGIIGCHNKANFLNEIDRIGAKIHNVSSSQIDGIQTYTYSVLKKDLNGNPIVGEYSKTFYKTVFDPSKISTDEYIARGIQAANNAAKESPSGILPIAWTGVDDLGISWRGYCDQISNKITTFFPCE